MTEHERCPSCGSDCPEVHGIIETSYTGGAGRVNLHIEREQCRDPWHNSPSPVPAEGNAPLTPYGEELLERERDWAWWFDRGPSHRLELIQRMRKLEAETTPSTERQCLIDLRNYHGKDCICPQCQLIDKALAEAESPAGEGEGMRETREQRADRFKHESGKAYHMSDCATSMSPAEEPGPCDCAAPEASAACLHKNTGYLNKWCLDCGKSVAAETTPNTEPWWVGDIRWLEKKLETAERQLAEAREERDKLKALLNYDGERYESWLDVGQALIDLRKQLAEKSMNNTGT